jgi:anti-anti-sigma regulatory factor
VEPLRPEPNVLGCDCSRITELDEQALDALVRLQLVARRMGATVRLDNASPALADLIELAGLADVLRVAPNPGAARASGVEVDGEIEEREEVGVDEEVHRGDGAV